MVHHSPRESAQDPRVEHTPILEDPGMNADLDALATELYVAIDDILITNPDLVPQRPKVGIGPGGATPNC